MLAVPLRIGGGSRLKILEALATGTPVVSTRVGAEGLQLTPGRDLIVTERCESLVGAIIAGIRRPDELQETAENGRRRVPRGTRGSARGPARRCVATPVSRAQLRVPA